MSHRFSNSTLVRAIIKMHAGQPMFKSWEDIPHNLRLLILIHVQDCIEEVLNEAI